ncbi:CPBP family intramembrane glutamic endopeptidase [Promethearchaeum syntrophicum]|uniref:CPBP family intramembrane glutamic endopeptidase n=1 Tax=Promethearchaeum syntrophicum TaxID=2594042 RepID=A0A5B9D617_9ARCH|nr:type II CAAX endopeptidase family protein [Candidatus Prometheoarchaeum syntrophicum]QEE14426.1 CAAX amino terminal protease self- immunity [Candidatus Prometheoarchaeum syntrophicum]
MKHPIRSYILIVFICSWLFWLLPLLSSANIVPELGFFGILQIFGAFCPTIIALIFIWKKKSLRSTFKKSLHFRFSFLWYIISIFFFPIIYGIVYLISTITGYHIESEFLSQPEVLPIVFGYILVLGGPLGEEFGWRALVLPCLMEKRKALQSSFLLGVIWAVWHLPLFFIEGTIQNSLKSPLYLIGYLIMTVLLSIFLTWIFLHTNNSVVASILVHTSSNFALGVFLPFSTLIGAILQIIFLIITIILIIVKDRNFRNVKE